MNLLFNFSVKSTLFCCFVNTDFAVVVDGYILNRFSYFAECFLEYSQTQTLMNPFTPKISKLILLTNTIHFFFG